jgi:hypothetical protein
VVRLSKVTRAKHLLLTSFVVLLLSTTLSKAGSGDAYTIKMLRWDEDYSYLRGDEDLAFPLSLKYLHFTNDGYISLGGEYRLRLESYEHPNFGLTHTPDYLALSNRALLHADIHWSPIFRVFLQLGYSEESGRKPVERPFDEGSADLAQGFFDVNWMLAGGRWRFRVGRQEIAIGRYVTIRDGTAIRRTFDGVRVDGEMGSWSILAFGARPTLNRREAFDDKPDSQDSAIAVVATHGIPWIQGFKLDLLALKRDFKAARYVAGFGQEIRDSLGIRLYGTMGNWDVDTQASHQFGHFLPTDGPSLTIDSWGAAFEGGFTFRPFAWSPRLAVRIDVAEGDNNRAGRTLTTFDLPYPNLTYLTDAAIIAPRNVADLDPFIMVQPSSELTLTAGAQYLWRLTPKDAVYSPIGTAIVPPNTAGSFVAAQPYVRVSWRPSHCLELQLAAVHAQSGKVVTSAEGHSQDYLSGSLAARF